MSEPTGRRVYGGLVEALKGIVRRSPLGPPAKALYRRLRPLTPSEVNERYDYQTSHVMARVLSADSNCLDIGAHTGAILRVMLQYAGRGRHIAFEPLPHLATQLRRDFSGVEVCQVALSDVTGSTTFQYVVSNPGYSGLRRRRYDRANEEVQAITVTTARLDDLVPKDRSIRLVKIDVEGGELQVIRGGLSMLARCRPFVVFEHGKGVADHYGATPSAVHEALAEGCGLRISTMERWLAGARPFSRAEFIEHFDRGRDFYFLAHP